MSSVDSERLHLSQILIDGHLSFHVLANKFISISHVIIIYLLVFGHECVDCVKCLKVFALASQRIFEQFSLSFIFAFAIWFAKIRALFQFPSKRERTKWTLWCVGYNMLYKHFQFIFAHAIPCTYSLAATMLNNVSRDDTRDVRCYRQLKFRQSFFVSDWATSDMGHTKRVRTKTFDFGEIQIDRPMCTGNALYVTVIFVLLLRRCFFNSFIRSTLDSPGMPLEIYIGSG